MLKFDNISAFYQDRTILHNISASFPYGTVSVFLGPNGCGKSTLLQCLFEPKLIQSGTIWLDNDPYFSYSVKDRAKRIAYLPQLYDTAPITVENLVTQGRYPYIGKFGMPNWLDLRTITRAMIETNVSELADRKLTTLSGGELRRAYLAMILAQNTDYVILDEPTTFLDIHQRLEFLDLLMKLRDRGKTIIVVLHDINEALKIADIIFLMADGKLLKTLSGTELLETNVIEEIFNVKMDYLLYNGQTLTDFRLHPSKSENNDSSSIIQ